MKPSDLPTFFDKKQPLPEGEQLKPGVFLNLPDATYRAFRGLNSSLLKIPTAAEMWHDMTAPAESHWDTDDKCLKWTAGILLHWAVLEPWKFKEFDQHIVASPTKGLATVRAQAVREAYPDKLVVTPELVTLAHNCYKALELNPQVRHLMSKPGGNEVSLFCWDEKADVWRKARFDRVPFDEDFLIDVKTTAFPLPQFPKEARKYGYHLQAKWYLDTWEMLTGERKRWFKWIVVNKSEPFMSMVWEVENLPRNHVNRARSPLGIADEIMDSRLATWCTCAWDTVDALRHHTTLSHEQLSHSLVRRCWPAYENSDAQLLTF